MRVFRRLILFLLLATAVLWLTRASIYRAIVHYRIVGERGDVLPLQVSMIGSMGLDLAIDAAMDTTAARLHFSTGAVTNDPRELLHGGPANCIGYAALCTSLLKGHLERAGLGGRYKVEAVIGKLYVGDQDLHAFFTSPFWKNHDVVRITDRTDNKVIVLDPTLYDHVGIGRVSIRSRN